MERGFIEGKWIGYYVNDMALHPDPSAESGYSSIFPISAEFRVADRSLTGTMIDEIPSYEAPLRLTLERAAVKMEDRIRRIYEFQLRQAPDLLMKVTLPTHSTLRGDWSDTDVFFVKTYLGKSAGVWSSGGRIITSSELKNSQVNYRGKFVEEGIIEGTWEIRPRLFQRHIKSLLTGAFRLTRG